MNKGKVDVLLGLQWGDEGKGKVVDDQIYWKECAKITVKSHFTTSLPILFCYPTCQFFLRVGGIHAVHHFSDHQLSSFFCSP